MAGYLQALAGGILVGLASWALFAGLGRIAGVSGILSTAWVRSEESPWRWAFLLGLIGGGAVFATGGAGLELAAPRPVGLMLLAGLLVGFGSVLGSGCTSGHGVCGLGRRSGRSLVAVVTFMATGFATVYVAASPVFSRA